MTSNESGWSQLSLEFTREELVSMLEAILFVATSPITMERLKEVLGSFYSEEDIKNALKKLQRTLAERNSALQILELAGGYRMATRPEFDHTIRRFTTRTKRLSLSKAALETLAIIAYKQPITTPEIEAIRGVSVGSILKNLLEKSLIVIKGRKKAVGKPLIYGTSGKFLEYFGLSDLSALPSIEEFYEVFDNPVLPGNSPSSLTLD